ncbi:PAS domain-containing hybrid sensor histidine kinase/response regulator [Thermodesulfatator atlanticus]|uniref:PAS domain-containing hybrid sensor histidine kinase/response regulator n=1 Tax=Thermodesulfatator atlanticus TaxID=501497 RepID=UPI0003B59E81|nr:PAS domain-containing hybrid sensor histidine kinase/response regulator [Thermodesulfatator atlanticus]
MSDSKFLKESNNKHLLSESEVKFRALTDFAAVGIYLYRETFIYVNPAFERITGYTLEELRKKKVWEIVHPDYQEMVKERVLARLRGEQPSPRYEIKIITKDGREKWIEISASTYKEGDYFVGIGTFIDITEVKNYSQKLAETLTEYKAILQAFEGYIYTVSQGFRIRFANPKLEEKIGKKIVGLTCYETIFARKEPCPWCSVPQVLEGQSVQKEIKIPKQDKWYHVVATPLVYPDGERFFFHLMVDITQQKKTQQEYLRATKLESLSLLASGIAHDFNNFLTAILGNLSLLRLRLQKKLSPKEEKLIKQAEKACLKAQGLTKQLLTFAKGGSPIKKAAPLKDLLEETISFCLRGSDITWELKVEDDLFLVDVDTVQFGQVVSNLVINAKQAMPQGGRLWVSAKNLVLDEPQGSLKPGKYVEISFRDEGKGIPEKYIHRIFDPYFTTKKEGSGLGLAICYSIVKNHGGHIEVFSKEGSGTTFKIYLPASKKEKFDTPSLVQQEIFKGQGKVLVFDDEETVRATLREGLELAGFQVEEAQDAQEVLKRAKDQTFDLAILDLTVPGGMGAKEIFPFLKSYNPKIKTILISGYVLDYEKHKEFDAILKKPFTLQELFETIRKLLNA